MNNNNQDERMSKSKKILTTFVVVGVLLVSAITINSLQVNAQLQAQTGFFSRIFQSFSSIFGDLFGFGSSSESSEVQVSSFADGEIVTVFGSEPVIDFNNFSSLQAEATRPNEFGVAYVEDGHAPDEGKSSYVVTFKADPIASKTKSLLKQKGLGDISPIKSNSERNDFTQKLDLIKSDIENQKTLIDSQQEKLLTKLTSQNKDKVIQIKSATGNDSVSNNGDVDIKVTTFKTTSNSVIIENISEDDFENLIKGVRNIKSIEPVKEYKVDLTETPEIIETVELAEFLGANASPLNGEGTIVAIVDTGVDYTHQDFGSCSFLEEGGCKVAYGYDFINEDSDPMDDHGHGTHVAATAAGDGFWVDSEGVTNPLPGIAPGATIYAYKVLSGGGSGTTTAVIRGMEACVDPNGDGFIDDRVTVCSLSLGSAQGSPMDATSLAADAAVDAGVIMTIAAGNDGPGFETVGSPGSSRKAITVGAACKPQDIGSNPRCQEAVASFSSRGPINFVDENNQEQVLQKPDIVAPGVSICAAQWSSWLDNRSCLGDGKHIAIDGTSMATPVVAGLMALLAQAHPDQTVEDLKETLKFTANDLGLDQRLQGQGMVSGINALEGLGGAPSTSLKITGFPLFFNSDSNETNSSETKELVFENITEEPLTFTIDQNTFNPGITTDYGPSEYSLAVGESLTIPFTINVDHSSAVSGSNIKERYTVSIDNGDVINVVATIRIPGYSDIDKEDIDFGLFHIADTEFSAESDIEISNRMTELDQVYTVEIEPVNAPEDNIFVTVPVDQIEVPAGDSVSVPISFDAIASQSNPLSVGIYKVNVRFVSSQETLTTQVMVYRGYSFEFEYGQESPDAIILARPGWQGVYYPDPSLDSLVLRAGNPGPYDAHVVYLNSDAEPKRVDNVFIYDIDVEGTTERVTYDARKSLVQNKVHNEFFGNSCFWNWTAKDGWPRFGSTGGGVWDIRYNDLPEDSDFAMTCGNFKPEEGQIEMSQIYITEDINSNFTINESNTDYSNRYIYGFNNREEGDTIALGIDLCNIRRFRLGGDIDGSPNMCARRFSSGGLTLDISEGEAASLEVYSYHTDTPETAESPTYPSFRISAFHREEGDLMDETILYSTPEIFATSDKLFLWNSPTSKTMTTEDSTTDVYEKNKIDVVNDNFITVGAGPIVDTSRVQVFGDQAIGGIITDKNPDFTAYQYADGSLETYLLGNPRPVRSRYNFFRNNSFFATSVADMENYFSKYVIFPDIDGLFSTATSPALGSYRITNAREGLYDGENQTNDFFTERTLNLSSDTSIDAVPPVLESIQLISNGMLQNNYDANVSNQIRFKLNPGLGVSNRNFSPNAIGAYDIEFLNDSLVNVGLQYQDSNGTWQNSDLSFQDGYYSAVITGDLGSTHALFKITANDASNNTFMYQFPVEVGEALTESSVADPGVLSCVQNQPILVVDPQFDILQADGVARPVEVSLTNTNSAACGPLPRSSVNVNLRDDAISISGPYLRVTDDPNQTGSRERSFDFGTGTILPGETRTITLYFEAEIGLYDYDYDAVFEVDVAEQDFTQVEVINVDSDFVHPFACGAQDVEFDLIDLEPSYDPGTATHSVNFAYTNADDSDCANVTYRVNVSDDNNQFATHKVSYISGSDRNFSDSRSVAPGQTIEDVLYFKNFDSSYEGPVNVTVLIEDATNNGFGPSHDVMEFDFVVNYGDVVDEDNGNEEEDDEDNGNEDIPAHCAADFNGDGVINTGDQVALNGSFGSGDLTYDLSGDGNVNTLDIIIFLTYIGGEGCPVIDMFEETNENNALEDDDIVIDYEISTSNKSGSTIYDYEIIITNNSDVFKTDLMVPNVIPDMQLPYANFTAATSPDVSVDSETGDLTLSEIEPFEAISVFVTVTMPN